MPGSQGIRAGKAFVEIGTKDDALKKGLDAAARRMKAFGAMVTSIGLKLTAAGGAIIAPILLAAKSFADAGSELQDLSTRLGITTDDLQELSYAARQTGASVEDLETGIGAMAKAIYAASTGGKEANEAFAELGLSISDIVKLQPVDQFELISKSLDKITNATKKAALAQKVFGRGGRQLIPMIKELGSLRQEWRGMGIALSPKDIAAADKLGDTFDSLKDTLLAIKNVIGAAVAPLLTDLMERAKQAAIWVGQLVNKNRGLFVVALKVGAAITALGAGLVATGIAVQALAFGVKGLAMAWAAMTAALTLIATPMGLFVAGVTAGSIALFKLSNTGEVAINNIIKGFTALGKVVYETWGGIVDAIAAGDLALAGSVAMKGLKVAFMQAAFDIGSGVAELLDYIKTSVIEAAFTIAEAINNIVSFFRKSYEGVINWVAKRINDLVGLFDDSFDADAANQILDDEHLRDISDIESERLEMLKELRRTEGLVNSETADAANARTKAAMDELAKAKQALQEARRNAADARKESEEDRAKELAKFKLETPDLSANIVKKISAIGTFNVAGSFGLASGSFSNLEKIAKDQLNVQKEIRDQGGFGFVVG